MKKPSALLLSAAFVGFVGVYEVAFAARYMAPIDLKPGTVAGFGVAIHDYNPDPKAKGGRNHATISTATREGKDLNEKPYLLPLMVLGE